MTVTTSAERYRRARTYASAVVSELPGALSDGRGAAGDPAAVRVRSMALRRHLVIFARELRLGKGKRRLACLIGDAAAIHFQRVALRALLLRLGRDRRWTTWVAVTPDRGRLHRLPPGVKQASAGRWRSGRADAATYAPPTAGHAAGAGGGDRQRIPDIRAANRGGVPVLGRHSFVFGPARDGGYWLVGARRRPAEPADIFRGARWSTEHALADTLAHLRPGRGGAGAGGSGGCGRCRILAKVARTPLDCFTPIDGCPL